MKRIISYAASFLIAGSVIAAPGSKLVEQFRSAFPNAQNVKWSDEKGGHFVSFNHNGNLEKIFYNKEGDFVCSWKYSDGKGLPTNITMMLNKKYSEGKIVGVTELSTQESMIYEVKLLKGSKLYSLNILPDGSIVKEKKFTYLG